MALSRSRPDSPPIAHINSTTKSPQPHSLPPDLEKQREEPPLSPKAKDSAFKSLGLLDQFLALWIFLAMAIGIILGNFVPSTGPALQRGRFVGVSVPIGESVQLRVLFFHVIDFGGLTSGFFCCVAVGLLVMMFPILCKVKFETLHRAFRGREIWVQVLFSVVVNWVVAPFVMVGFLSFVSWVDEERVAK